MYRIFTEHFYTARERQRLLRICENGRCVWCLAAIDFEKHWGGDDCSECGNPTLSDSDLIYGAICPFCEHQNPLPKPLDADIHCQKCGEAM